MAVVPQRGKILVMNRGHIKSHKKKPSQEIPARAFGSTAYGIRTRATAVKGRRPKPLDERGIKSVKKLCRISIQQS